jgi:uncharacterized membrane protein YfcA
MGASEIRPLALVLNVLVASLAAWQFARAGHGRRAVLVWLVAGSIPAAIVGGALVLPAVLLKRLLAWVLLFSAWRLTLFQPVPSVELRVPSVFGLCGTGAALGWLAGLTGTGGGMFLTPWMILRRWLQPKDAAGVSAAFILVNSLAGLSGLMLREGPSALPGWSELWPMALAVMAGGWFGAWCGSSRFEPLWIRRILAGVLLLASGKLLGIVA